MLQGLGLNRLDTLNTYANWEKIEGRGNVVFSNPNASYTSAKFTLPGKYILRYSVEDRTLLATKGKYYTLMDEVIVVVEEDIIIEPIDLICKKDTVIYTTSDFALVDWKLPKINSPACSEGIFNIEQLEGPENGSMLQVGEWRITYRVYDDCQREGRCSFVVKIVKEVKEFEVKCPEDIRLTLPVGQFSVRVNWDLPKVFSVCETGFRIKRVKGLPSGSVFGLGISEIVYEITDECGHREICTFYVVITFPIPNQEDGFGSNQNLEYIVSVAPNPAQSYFSVETVLPATGKTTLSLIDQLGRVQYEQQEWLEAGATRVACSIGQLPKGWYLLQISQHNIVLGSSVLLVE
ncbi:MAG: HYR domain-containing protein [Saprospiraceae bacterium]|nr:HYR domain-containing protein [Saprospiraceae bacterium]